MSIFTLVSREELEKRSRKELIATLENLTACANNTIEQLMQLNDALAERLQLEKRQLH